MNTIQDSYLASNVAVSIGVILPLMVILGLQFGKVIRFKTFLSGMLYSAIAKLIYNLFSNALFDYFAQYSGYLNMALAVATMFIALLLYSKKVSKDNDFSKLSYGIGYGAFDAFTSFGSMLLYNRIILSQIANGNIYKVMADTYDMAYIEEYIATYLSIDNVSYYYSAAVAILIIGFDTIIHLLMTDYLENKKSSILAVVLAAVILFHGSVQLLGLTNPLISIVCCVIILAVLTFIYFKRRKK